MKKNPKCSWLQLSNDWLTKSLAPRLGNTPGFTLDINRTSFWTGHGRSRNFTSLTLLPSLSRQESARANFAVRMRPSELRLTVQTRTSCQWPRGELSSLMITMSSTPTSFRDTVHFWRCCELSRYSFRHRDQNSLAKCWTRLQRFLQNLSAHVNTPGGERTTFLFIVSRWLGVRRLSKLGSFKRSTVNGQLLMIASTSHMNLRSDSSSSCRPLFWRRGDRMLLTVRIGRSQTPPTWLEDGTFMPKVNQSQFSWSNSALMRSWSSSASAAFNSCLAPTKFVPWSLRSWRTGPLRHIKRRSAFIKASVSSEVEVSKWTALEAKHVNRTPYLFICFLPSLMEKGPK